MAVFDPIIVNINVLQTPQKADFLRRFCIVSDGNSNITKGTIEMVTAENWNQKVTASNETSKWLTSFFTMARGKVAYIYELKASDTAANKLKELEAFIKGKTLPCYNYSLPEILYKDAYLQTMLTGFSDVGTPVYFSANIALSGMTDPTATTEYNYWKGKKAFMAIYPSAGDASLNTDGLVSGVKASAAFDLSTTTTSSSLDYKKVASYSKTLDTTTLTKIASAPCCVTINAGNLNQIQNSKMADGEFWHYRYNEDTLISILQANIQALFTNASNTTGGAIKYNDSGIQSIKQNLISTINTAISMGLVNRFARGIDIATNQLIGIGDLGTIPFEQYKNDNPQNYKDGVYDAFTGYIEIQNFIRQIKFNVTLG